MPARVIANVEQFRSMMLLMLNHKLYPRGKDPEKKTHPGLIMVDSEKGGGKVILSLFYGREYFVCMCVCAL